MICWVPSPLIFISFSRFISFSNGEGALPWAPVHFAFARFLPSSCCNMILCTCTFVLQKASFQNSAASLAKITFLLAPPIPSRRLEEPLVSNITSILVAIEMVHALTYLNTHTDAGTASAAQHNQRNNAWHLAASDVATKHQLFSDEMP